MDATGLNCDNGQEGMITDAQAAELLMRVSEQRPLSLQNQSNVPYVQVQLAQTVEGITHVVEVPVSALGYLPSTLVYSTPVNSGTNSNSEMATWVVEAPPAEEQQQQQLHQTSDNKFSDIVSASIEAIGFPESRAEQILISDDGSAPPAEAMTNFEFDESSNSSMTLLSEKGHSAHSYPRPKRESIESRINRLLRGDSTANSEESSSNKTPLKSVKLPPPQSPKPLVSNHSNLEAIARRPGRPSDSRPIAIPTIYTSTGKPTHSPSPGFPSGGDYFMPRGVSKRKAQNFKVLKTNPSNPDCIDAEPAPPEETQVLVSVSFYLFSFFY